MINTQNCKYGNLVRPGAIVNGGSWTSQNIDTLGFSYFDACFQLGAIDIDMTVLKLQHSEDGATSWADISGAAFSTFPTSGDDNGIFHIAIPLHGKRRYIRCVATIGSGSTGGYMSAFSILSRPVVAPNSSTERGFAGEVIGS